MRKKCQVLLLPVIGSDKLLYKPPYFCRIDKLSTGCESLGHNSSYEVYDEIPVPAKNCISVTLLSMYIVSRDLELGGTIINILSGAIVNIRPTSNSEAYLKAGWRKIIASINKTLPYLPSIPKEFLYKYRDTEPTMVENVLVEKKEDNSISISLYKDTYSREEVVTILKKMQKDICKGIKISDIEEYI